MPSTGPFRILPDRAMADPERAARNEAVTRAALREHGLSSESGDRYHVADDPDDDGQGLHYVGVARRTRGERDPADHQRRGLLAYRGCINTARSDPCRLVLPCSCRAWSEDTPV